MNFVYFNVWQVHFILIYAYIHTFLVCLFFVPLFAVVLFPLLPNHLMFPCTTHKAHRLQLLT